jgi:serine protease Do
MTTDLASGLGLKEVRGVLVRSITPGGPADKAGLKAGDVILKLNGKDVNDDNVLRNQIAAAGPGASVTLTIWRDGKEQDIQATLTELTADNARAGGGQGGSAETGGRLGITVATLTPEIAGQIGVPRNTQGVVVQEVDADGPAAQAGIEAGDVITQVNRQPVRSPADMRSALDRSPNGPALLLINRRGQTVFVPVPLG